MTKEKKSRHNCKKITYRIVLFIVFLVLIFGLKTLSIIKTNNEVTYNEKQNQSRLNSSGSWNLPPQFIDGSATGVGAYNWTWVKAQPWFGGGNGSWGNPYIIENITIDASYSTDCFKIVNTDQYFILKNCKFTCSSSDISAGLKMTNVNNSLIINNDLSSNEGHGIYLTSCNNNTIFNNSVDANGRYSQYPQHGIHITNSHFNNISNNSIKSNKNIGIRMNHCNHNKIINNNLGGNGEYGIWGYSCENCIFLHNSFDRNGDYITGGGFSLADCSHTVFSNNTFSENYGRGADIQGCENLTLSNNLIIGSSQIGLYLSDVYESFFFNNTMDYNNGYGLFLSYGDNNEINNNSINYNLYDGMFFYFFNNNSIENNSITQNDQNGIEFYTDCNMNNLTGNSINNNHQYGLFLSNSDNNRIIMNILIDNQDSIHETDCVGNFFLDNICSQTKKLFIELVEQIYTSEKFNISLLINDEFNSGISVDLIQMWWNGTDVSSDVKNLGEGNYFVSLDPITVTPGDAPILLNMTAKAEGFEEKYFETFLAVDPKTLEKGTPQEPEEPEEPEPSSSPSSIPGYNLYLFLVIISLVSVTIIKKKIK
ncbi:MAG: nitrous oxide reductase family maturation protein NosD [Promethearchaeota archaeon]